MDLYTGEQPPPLAQSFLMGVWGVGANQSSPSTYAGALPPCSTAHPIRPRLDGFSPLVCRNQQICSLLVKTGWCAPDKARGKRRIVAAPACYSPVSEWHRLVNEHRRAFRRRADPAQSSQSSGEISSHFTPPSFKFHTRHCTF